MKNKISILILVCIMILLVGYCLFGKTPIQEATFDDLMAMDEIDETLSHRVLSYIQYNKNLDIDDLLDVKGIGEKRLKIIKRRYK